MMQTITLGTTGRTTSQLGFGCTALMGAISERASLKLLATAYDAGIRHFDTAPSYGHGASERCLGKFIEKKNDITVTTKYGILPPRNPKLSALVRRIARPLVKIIPSLKNQFSHATPAAVSFTAAAANASLEKSLQKLERDRIDIWLLHEASAGQLRDDGLLDFLQQCVASGKIGTFGFGGESSKVPDLYQQRRAYCPVLQYEWSVEDALPNYPDSFRIHHRALSDAYQILGQQFAADPARAIRWSQAVGHDLHDEKLLARLMLKAALVMNPQSVILFSSRNPAHILQNVSVAEDESLEIGARKFYEFYQSEKTAQPSRLGQE